MFRNVLRCACLLILFAGCVRGPAQETARVLRVCADPNNLPFSNQRQEGFENRLAELLAAEMEASVEYTWWPQRRAFLRHTLRAGECDVVMGVPSSYELVLASRPYYRSTYVFVTRTRDDLDIRSFDDPRLRELRVGVHLVGDDYANTPPVHALSNRGIVHNVRGYRLYGDYSRENPTTNILDGLVAGEVDVAIVWGPLAGYFATRYPVELTLTPVSPQIELPFLPMVYDIALGVRREDTLLVNELNEILVRRAAAVDSLLAEYGVPTLSRRRGAAGHVRMSEALGAGEAGP